MLSKDNEIVALGETNFRNQRWRFGIKTDDRRRHMYVVGSTGMGKSEFLKNMAIQDIEAGRGVAFIDPHGDPSDSLLDHIPEHRIKDVIYFDPSDLEFPVAFNIMEEVHYDYRHLIASGLLGVFKKIWGAEVWSGRMEYILNNTILALLEYPDSNLLGINKMMAVKSYRNKVVANLKDPIVKSFWVDEFAKYAERFATEATAAIQNKVGQFSSNNVIRNIIGQFHSKFDVRKIMDEGKILIVNVSKGKIGEDASRLLGALLITKIQLAAMSRVDTPEKDRRDFYLYVDEFQNFATESFANILSEARKFHLNLVVAHQYIKQMEEPVRDAVFGNVGTIVSFRVGAEDGEFLEKWFQPDFLMNDIVNLGKYNIYLKLMIDGASSKGFSAQTILPIPKLEKSNREAVIEHSRATYATPRAEVEKSVAEWALSTDEEVKPQRKDNYSRQDNYPRQDNYGGSNTRPAPRQDYPSYDRPRPPAPRFDRPERSPEQYREERPVSSQPSAPRVEESLPRVEQSVPAPKVEQSAPIRPVQPPQSPPRTIGLEPSSPRPQSSITSARPPEPARQRPSEEASLPTGRQGSTEVRRPNVEPQARPMSTLPSRPPMRSDEPVQSTQFYQPPQPRQQQPKQPESRGISLNDALKQGPVNFRGRRIEERKEKLKAEVNTDELRKVLEEAMGKKE